MVKDYEQKIMWHKILGYARNKKYEDITQRNTNILPWSQIQFPKSTNLFFTTFTKKDDQEWTYQLYHRHYFMGGEILFNNIHYKSGIKFQKQIKWSDYYSQKRVSPTLIMVKPDGHCGYRALSYLLFQNEDYWQTVRTDMANYFKKNYDTQ